MKLILLAFAVLLILVFKLFFDEHKRWREENE